ncbi:MAG: MBL fold metallo-hydrolase [Rhizobiales bacterium NRL2]|jgi:glyoxylase-like metal-dependent hydrolase (beta-lactamase superfamily II)|nr:MAG: MBL fold metallo-hydrolase [Rhizobiales bacterium NRL2]
MQSWKIGKVKVTKIVEMEVPGGTRFILPDATKEACQPIEWMKPHFMTEEGRLIMSIHALVIETPDRRIVVDTCLGNDKKREIPAWSDLSLPFLEDMEKAGYPADSIDTVMCTHLHVDHVGWNTRLVDGKWVPTFTGARYLMATPEFDYWRAKDDDPASQQIFADSVQPVFDAGLVDFVDTTHRICPEVTLMPTHGHTPGHVSVLIESEGEKAMITGDFVHHPCQMARVDWCSTADYDQKAAQATRERVFAEFAETPTLIIGTHFAGATAGYLRKDGDAYRLDV